MTKAQKISAMLEKGKSPAMIAEKLDTSRQYVYAVASARRKAKDSKTLANKLDELSFQNSETTLWQRFIRWIKGE